MIDISVVIPVYGCKEALNELYTRLCNTLTTITDNFEIILVNDACPQNSWEVIKKLCESDSRVVGLNMSRNFGQIRAITAGLDACSGNYVVVMDCDLQDRPEGIIDLYNKINEGYDVVFARRKNRRDNLMTRLLSRMFYKIYNYFSDGNFDASICNFNISRRLVIDNYCKMREQNRGYTIFLKWLGFNSTTIDIEHDERAAGKSSYNLRKKIGMAISFITAQSNKPLCFAIYVGLAFVIFAFILVVYYIINYFTAHQIPSGYTSMIVSLYIIGGMILIVLGMLGLYIGNIFNETKKRPLYVLKETLNLKGEQV